MKKNYLNPCKHLKFKLILENSHKIMFTITKIVLECENIKKVMIGEKRNSGWSKKVSGGFEIIYLDPTMYIGQQEGTLIVERLLREYEVSW